MMRIALGDKMLGNKTRWHRRSKSRCGVLMVEFAIQMPLLMLIMVGAADFSRVFYHSITVANASGVGSFYGSEGNIKAANFAMIKTLAASDAKNLTGLTVTPSLYCDCPDGATVDCITGTCGTYGSPRVYAKTKVEQTFRLFIPWPGVPDPVHISAATLTRVQ